MLALRCCDGLYLVRLILIQHQKQSTDKNKGICFMGHEFRDKCGRTHVWSKLGSNLSDYLLYILPNSWQSNQYYIHPTDFIFTYLEIVLFDICCVYYKALISKGNFWIITQSLSIYSKTISEKCLCIFFLLWTYYWGHFLPLKPQCHWLAFHFIAS